MTLLNAGTVKTSPLHRTNAAPDGALPTDPWEAMASRAGLSPQAGEVQVADAQDDGAAFPRRLSRKHYVRRPPLSNGENSYLKRTPVHSSPAGLFAALYSPPAGIFTCWLILRISSAHLLCSSRVIIGMQNIMLIDVSIIMATVVTIVCMLRINITNDVSSD